MQGIPPLTPHRLVLLALSSSNLLNSGFRPKFSKLPTSIYVAIYAARKQLSSWVVVQFPDSANSALSAICGVKFSTLFTAEAQRARSYAERKTRLHQHQKLRYVKP